MMKRVLCGLLAAGLIALCLPSHAAESRGYGCEEVVIAPDGSWVTRMSAIDPDDLAKEVDAALGSAGSVLTVSGACYSGIYTEAFKNHSTGNTAHLGPSNKNEKTKNVRERKTGDVTGYLDGLLDVWEADSSKTVTNAHNAAAENDPNNPDGKFGDDVKRSQAAHELWRNSPKNKDRKDEIPPASEEVPEHPQQETTGSGATIKLKNGTKSNHGLIVVGLPGAVSRHYTDRWEKLLTDNGFDSVEVLYDRKGEPVPDGHGGTLPNPGWATKGNITRTIQGLQGQANSNEHFVLVFLGHTARYTTSNATQTGQAAGSGANFSQASNTDNIGLSDNFTCDLLEETSIIDSPAMYRMYQPFFYLRTLNEALSNPTVGVSINGSLLGNLTLENDPGGGYYTLPFSDSFLESTLTDIGATTLNVSFTFGGPNDSFQLATQADLLGQIEAGSLYGMGVATICHGEAVPPLVPEPGALGLVGLGLVGLVRRRRRS